MASAPAFALFDLGGAENPVVSNLQKAGFTCRHPGGNGYVCHVDNVHADGFNYPQPVAVIVPETVELPITTNLYLQGFRYKGSVCQDEGLGADAMVDHFGLLQSTRGTNAVTVFPLSEGKDFTYHDKLTKNFPSFLKWINRLSLGNGDWWVGGHSGAGAVMNQLICNTNFAPKKVIYLDATYQSPSGATCARRKNPNAQIAATYIDSRKSGTVRGGNALRSMRGAVVHTAKHLHCQIVNNEYGELLGGADTASKGSLHTASVPNQSAVN